MLSCYLGCYLRLAVFNCLSEMIRPDSLDDWSHRMMDSYKACTRVSASNVGT